MVVLKNKIKGITGLIVFLLALNAFITPSLGFIHIYEDSQQQNLAKGVIHERILRFTDLGWLGLNVVRIDLNEEDVDLDVLFSSKGIANRETLSGMTKDSSDKKIVAAINGDFYDTRDFGTMGPVVKDGKIITSSLHDPQFATFNIDEDNNPFLTYWGQSRITLINEYNNYQLNVDFINKPYLDGYADRVVLIDRNWNTTSFGVNKHQYIVEMVIIDNRVAEIRNNLEPIEIPVDGYIIVGVGATKQLILNNFSVGDRVSLDIKTIPDFEKLKLAIGGGAVLIENGNIVQNFSLNVSGRHPRTAIGITKDNRELILLTVDGRTSSYVGVTQEELAKILLELGAYNAINLDGGGSTEMLVRNLGDTELSIANNLSSGSERKIMNGLAVINDSRNTSLKGIIIECEDRNVFANTTRVFTVKGYDTNYNPVEIEQNKVSYSVEGVEGNFIGNVFFPKGKGTGIIRATYQGKTASIPIRVLGTPVKLEISPSKIFVDTGSQIHITAKAIDDDGYSAKVNPKDLIWSIPQGIVEVKGDTLVTSSKPGNDIITVSLGNVNAYIQVANGYEEVVLTDFEKLNGSFLSYPEAVTGSYELTGNSRFGSRAGKLEYDFTNSESSSNAAYLVFDNSGITIERKPERLGLWVHGTNGNNHWLRARITDAKGTEYNIDFSKNIDWNGWKFLEANIPGEAEAPLKLQRIYIVETDIMKRDRGYIYLDNLTALYKSGFTKTPPKDTDVFLDKRNAIASLQGENSFKLFAHGNVRDSKTLLDNLVMNKIIDLTMENGKAIFANSINKKLKDNVSNLMMIDTGYSLEKYKNSTFIKLDNSKGGIRETDYRQWIWFLDNIKKLDTKNVFIMLPSKLNFKDPLEEELFYNCLSEIRDKGIDLWVILGGDNEDFNVTAKDGIRYVTLKSYPNKDKIDIFNDLTYMEFTVNDGYVTYQIKNMY